VYLEWRTYEQALQRFESTVHALEPIGIVASERREIPDPLLIGGMRTREVPASWEVRLLLGDVCNLLIRAKALSPRTRGVDISTVPSMVEVGREPLLLTDNQGSHALLASSVSDAWGWTTLGRRRLRRHVEGCDAYSISLTLLAVEVAVTYLVALLLSRRLHD